MRSRFGDGDDDELSRKLGRLRADLGPLGVDPFGFDPKTVASFAGPIRWLYRHYFRVVARGVDDVPDGRVLLVSNHSGQLPFDGLMIAVAVTRPVSSSMV